MVNGIFYLKKKRGNVGTKDREIQNFQKESLTQHDLGKLTFQLIKRDNNIFFLLASLESNLEKIT